MFTSVRRWAAVTALTAVVATAAWAADASGKWTWTVKRGQNDITSTLELKQEGDKLTGSIASGPNNTKTEIKDGTATGSDVAFTVVRVRNGQEFKQAYKGKVDGDTIKGTVSFSRDGKDMTREWTATRVK